MAGGAAWRLAHGRRLALGARAAIMGILNVTPDSFSDGGRHVAEADALRAADRMLADGADIIDIGGESTRPGAEAVSAETEQARALPIVEALASRAEALTSIDTYRASTALKAIRSGAHIVNDVWGLRRDPDLAHVVADTGAGVVIMHSNRERETLLPPIDDQLAYFEESLAIACGAGIEDEAIVLDPGFGFGKETVEANLAVMVGLERLVSLGYPILIGSSRKRFLGTISGRDPEGRDVATAATSALLRMKGAAIFRVHDVASNRDALAVADALRDAKT